MKPQNLSAIDPEVFDISLNASLSEGCSANITKGQKVKNKKRKLNVESQLNESAKDDLNVKSGNANINKGQKGKNKKRKLDFESDKDNLNVKSDSANIIELKGRKGKNSKNLSGISDS